MNIKFKIFAVVAFVTLSASTYADVLCAAGITKVKTIRSANSFCSGGKHVAFKPVSSYGPSTNGYWYCSTNHDMDAMLLEAYKTRVGIKVYGPNSWGSACYGATNGGAIKQVWFADRS